MQQRLPWHRPGRGEHERKTFIYNLKLHIYALLSALFSYIGGWPSKEWLTSCVPPFKSQDVLRTILWNLIVRKCKLSASRFVSWNVVLNFVLLFCVAGLLQLLSLLSYICVHSVLIKS